jgi:glutamate/tyrosine decarboxylase-like PLP-dependent enzyme
VKTARDHARVERPGHQEPEIVAPVSAHPAFDKAAHYLCMKVRPPYRCAPTIAPTWRR